MNLEKLKEQARRHEQKEEWPKALELYKKAIGRLKNEEQPDIGIYNRAGDIQARIGDLEGAVKHYERAVELYLEAELPNNAIAICKKVLRNLPARATAYLRMGQIRASQGFLTDARQNFLAYAELMQEAGEMEEAFRALIEFTNLAPHDMDIRAGVAAQLASHGSVPEAVEQLTVIYQYRMREGAEEAAEQIKEQILALDPKAEIPTDFGAPLGAGEEDPDLGFETTSLDGGDEAEDDEVPEYEFGEIEAAGEGAGDDPDDEASAAAAGMKGLEGSEIDDGGEEGGFTDVAPVEIETDPEFEVSGDFEIDAGDEDADADLDTGDGADEDDEGDIGGDLPLMNFDDSGESDEPAADLDADLEADLEIGLDTDLPLMSFDGAEEGGNAPDGDLDFEKDPGSTGPDDRAEGAGPGDDAVEAGWEDISFEEKRGDGEPDGESEGEPEGDPEEARRRGEALLEEGDRAAGLAALDQAHRIFAGKGEVDRAMRVVREVILHDPDDPAHHQKLVEYAYRADDRTLLIPAFIDLAECLVRSGQGAKAKAVYQQVLEVDPRNRKAAAGMSAIDGEGSGPSALENRAAGGGGAAAGAGAGGGGDFLDLGSMVLDEGERDGTTRWTVSAEAPSGDEEADFRRLLSQFKAKVAENVDSADFKAHYDLGTAYREMGLLDEAIGEFQQAQRASGGNLATFEMLGQCFLDLGQPEVAVRTLKKALDIPFQVEDELLAIYYHLARASEELDDRDQALDYYEKVFALDINFLDVTERLRTLRA